MFDITKHQWSSVSLISCEVLDDGDIEVEQADDAFWLSKQDAIAIAKHFKIIPEDMEKPVNVLGESPVETFFKASDRLRESINQFDSGETVTTNFDGEKCVATEGHLKEVKCTNITWIEEE